MTVERHTTQEFDAPIDRVTSALRDILCEQRSSQYKYTETRELRGGLFETRISPFMPLMLSTRMTIALASLGARTRVTVSTRSQWFILGDVFEMYRGYIEDCFLSITGRLQGDSAHLDRSSGKFEESDRVRRIAHLIKEHFKRVRAVLSADPALCVFLLFAASVNAFEELAARAVQEFVLPHTGWVPSAPYAFALFLVLYALLWGANTKARWLAIPFLSLQIAFGLRDWISLGPRASENPYLHVSEWRPLWTVAIPLFWITVIAITKPRLRTDTADEQPISD